MLVKTFFLAALATGVTALPALDGLRLAIRQSGCSACLDVSNASYDEMCTPQYKSKFESCMKCSGAGDGTSVTSVCDTPSSTDDDDHEYGYGEAGTGLGDFNPQPTVSTGNQNGGSQNGGSQNSGIALSPQPSVATDDKASSAGRTTITAGMLGAALLASLLI